MNIVIDTNVAIAANGRDTHACLECQMRCIELLEQATAQSSRMSIVLDSLDEIITEYKKHLNYVGQPGLGDAFYKYLHDHMYDAKKITAVEITPNNDLSTGYDELPINSLDKSDRKFLAAALITNGKIINAVDTDWHEQRDLLNALAVEVDQLCPFHAQPN